MLRSLFGNVHLNGRLNSQLLKYMNSLLGNKHMDDEIMRQLRLDKLLANIILSLNQPLASKPGRPSDGNAEMQRTSYTPFLYRNRSRLSYVKDFNNDLMFLMDTGAEVSVIPAPHRHLLHPKRSLHSPRCQQHLHPDVWSEISTIQPESTAEI